MDFVNFNKFNKRNDAELPCAHKAMLWGMNDLLARAVYQILESEATWNVINVANDSGIEVLLQEARLFAPDVIILCQDGIDDVALLLQLIQNQLCSRVVTVSTKSNHINVYSKQSVVLQDVAELLPIVDGSYFKSCAGGENSNLNR